MSLLVNPNTRLRPLFCAVAVSAALTACGGGSDNSDAPSTAVPGASATVPGDSAPTQPARPPSSAPAPAPTPSPAPSPSPSPSPSPAPITTGSTACPTPTGRVLEVGPGKSLPVPSAAAAVAQSGDTIQIAAGDYRGDVATWRTSNLTICGVGGRARLFADGRNAGGKGIWVISPSGGTTTIVNVEFHDATVPDQNGAGIRFESGNLVLRNAGFYDNENGILGGSGSSTITIEGSEFARNGFGDGYTHNIYIGQAARLTVRNSYFHEAKVGHNLKSRAAESVIENSYFMDGPDGTASYLLDFPNGGIVTLRGNLLHKGPKASNTSSVAYGAEGLVWGTNTLTMTHNTLVTTQGRGTFVSVNSGTQRATLTANLFAGSATVVSGVSGSALSQSASFTTSASNVPGADSISAPNFWPTVIASQITLSTVPDAGYAFDSPKPFTLRSLSVMSGRRIGALQTAP